MLAVRLGAEDVEACFPQGASIAAINSPSLCVVSGPDGADSRSSRRSLKRKTSSPGSCTRRMPFIPP